MFDLKAEAESIRIYRHHAQQERNHRAAQLMIAGRIAAEHGDADLAIAIEALADRIVTGTIRLEREEHGTACKCADCIWAHNTLGTRPS